MGVKVEAEDVEAFGGIVTNELSIARRKRSAYWLLLRLYTLSYTSSWSGRVDARLRYAEKWDGRERGERRRSSESRARREGE